jgi:hypothetical protein
MNILLVIKKVRQLKGAKVVLIANKNNKTTK